MRSPLSLLVDDGTTPTGATVYAQLPSGERVDITVGVQALYDLVLSSMDWGSGFLSLEDAIPVADIARICGFEGSDEAERYVEEERRKDEKRESLRREHEAAVARQAAQSC